MTVDRRATRRPYFFEIFVIANIIAIHLFAAAGSEVSVLRLMGETFRQFFSTMVLYTAVGVGVRLIVAAFSGGVRDYVNAIRTAGWISDSIRLAVFGVLTMHAYFWIKLLIPVLHPRLFDQELWDLDQAMLGGFSPNIAAVTIFSAPSVLRTIDWSYARVFFASMTVAYAFFLSAPGRRVRMAFTTGNTVMWLVGAWLYMAIPSVGPAYRFPDVWFPLADGLPLTQHFQALLMRNYQNMIRVGQGINADVMLGFGVAAFPSLHVAFQTFAFLWMRRLWVYGQIVFGVFMLVILIGSVVTGWHYLIDGIAGILLALGSYWMSSRMWRVQEWLRIRSALRSAAKP